MSSKNIAIYSAIALVISFSLFFLIMYFIPDSDFQAQSRFYAKDIPSGKKIFLVGSSHIFALNTTIITDQLAKNGYHYDVYNLGQASDEPESRLRTIDMIIAKKPDIVVYGIDFREFESEGRSVEGNSEHALPDITDLYKEISFPISYGTIENPKFTIIRAINSYFKTNDDTDFKIPYPNTPFFKYNVDDTITATESELEKKDVRIGEIYPPQKNLGLLTLKKIIYKLQDNGIKVIVFTTPHSAFWLEQEPSSQKQIFDSIVKDLEKEFSFKIYKLHDKYGDMSVWKDNTHLAINQKTSFYSTDVTRIILSEIET